MSPLPRLAVLLLAFSVTATAVAGPTEDERARNAVRVLADIQQIPESAIPDKLLDEARAIVVVPDTLKIGLVFGGRRGHGLVSVKNPDGGEEIDETSEGATSIHNSQPADLGSALFNQDIIRSPARQTRRRASASKAKTGRVGGRPGSGGCDKL